MRFLIDAQLPYKLKGLLQKKGVEVIHTDDLPDKERTSDSLIRKISSEEKWIVITKDSDFLHTHLLHQKPTQLLFITTGNIVNRELFNLIENNWDKIVSMFEECNLLELDNSDLIGHEK